MDQIVDQVLTRHPESLEARLIKAGILWHFYGDRDGARCHCLDLLNRTPQDDPLFDQICDLYLRTYQPWPQGETASDPANSSDNVIPFRPERPRAASPN
jgi:hypothetical protein